MRTGQRWIEDECLRIEHLIRALIEGGGDVTFSMRAWKEMSRGELNSLDLKTILETALVVSAEICEGGQIWNILGWTADEGEVKAAIMIFENEGRIRVRSVGCA